VIRLAIGMTVWTWTWMELESGFESGNFAIFMSGKVEGPVRRFYSSLSIEWWDVPIWKGFRCMRSEKSTVFGPERRCDLSGSYTVRSRSFKTTL